MRNRNPAIHKVFRIFRSFIWDIISRPVHQKQGYQRDKFGTFFQMDIFGNLC